MSGSAPARWPGSRPPSAQDEGSTRLECSATSRERPPARPAGSPAPGKDEAPHVPCRGRRRRCAQRHAGRMSSPAARKEASPSEPEPSAFGQLVDARMGPMPARLVLVHSPLVGPETWQLVASSLVAHGHDAVIPDLTASLAGPPYAARQAQAIADQAGGGGVVLIGHSGAGPLLALAGSRLDDVRGYVFVDAGLPRPGQSSRSE